MSQMIIIAINFTKNKNLFRGINNQCICGRWKFTGRIFTVINVFHNEEISWFFFSSMKHLGMLTLVWPKLRNTGKAGDEPTRFYCCLLGNKQTLALLAYWHSHGPYQLAVVGEGGGGRTECIKVKERLMWTFMLRKHSDYRRLEAACRLLHCRFWRSGGERNDASGHTPGETPLHAWRGRPYSKLSKACCLTVKSVRCRSVTRKLGRILGG